MVKKYPSNKKKQNPSSETSFEKYSQTYKSVSQSKTLRSGLIFSVPYIATLLRQTNYFPKLTYSGTIAMTAILEYISAELIDICVGVTFECNKNRIDPQIILDSIRSDHEMTKLFGKKWIVVMDKKGNPVVAEEIGRGFGKAIGERERK